MVHGDLLRVCKSRILSTMDRIPLGSALYAHGRRRPLRSGTAAKQLPGPVLLHWRGAWGKAPIYIARLRPL